MTVLSHVISAIFCVCLTPLVAYVAWLLLNVVIDLVPPLRNWRDFRGLDLGPIPRRRLAANIHRARPAAGVISPTPPSAIRGHAVPALPAGAVATNVARAEVT